MVSFATLKCVEDLFGELFNCFALSHEFMCFKVWCAFGLSGDHCALCAIHFAMQAPTAAQKRNDRLQQLESAIKRFA